MKILTIAAVIIAFLLPGQARADGDVRRTVQFLGFSEDGSHFLLKVEDANRGTYLSLKSFASNKQEKSYPIEDLAQERNIIKDAKRRHRISDPGKDSQIAPDENHTMIGIPKGHRYEIAALRDGKLATVTSIDVPRGSEGYAKVVLSGMYWNRDGHKIVIVVHKTLAGDRGLDADEELPIEFFAGSLRF